jgi:hypothetical protein
MIAQAGSLEVAVLALLQQALSRTSPAFGNYALGIRDAVTSLLPFLNCELTTATCGGRFRPLTILDLLSELEERLK